MDKGKKGGKFGQREKFAATLSIVLFVPWTPPAHEDEAPQGDAAWRPRGRPRRSSFVPNPILWYSSRPAILKNRDPDDMK
ncbi:MAG: hypothetical protein LBQ56_07905 [Synergistaceae bacterium]|jgi:hypothetical protein|nr:hypothetical protein [Synergistaceae bacterium]